MDVQTEAQLSILDEITAISSSLGQCSWLRGGWAIDFLLGEITRSHRDIDLVTWIQNRVQLEHALLEAGYKQLPVKKPFDGRQSDFCKNHVDIQYAYITRTSGGSLIMNEVPEWVWRADSLLPGSFNLNGIMAYVLNPRQLLQEKEAYQQIGYKHRPKDFESKKKLQRIIKERFQN